MEPTLNILSTFLIRPIHIFPALHYLFSISSCISIIYFLILFLKTINTYPNFSSFYQDAYQDSTFQYSFCNIPQRFISSIFHYLTHLLNFIIGFEVLHHSNIVFDLIQRSIYSKRNIPSYQSFLFSYSSDITLPTLSFHTTFHLFPNLLFLSRKQPSYTFHTISASIRIFIFLLFSIF